ncbi:Sterol desaturase/sphingolipid hydroxylase, fatty acid hydroxylase superfamily [Erythrobacter litoralis]|jgi:sterol desaturase/sphingolipid hydroxylase (fatty acid hydroxylase superfamily)|uniref:C-5 sterol desaturase n=1 Tax=Erythrobacter litoralis TaxID=39960 RepID=A0A074MGR4_9SPHN|nr:sterol desaturase family protein [Erythrobacter litoralis]AOL22207.1 Sterol desaturase/sphingolipid hydroxylase, fatty acid hydroxylase superfamily [Erythrobacter litoralis]KEO91043.1 C-5 sterol desaturase [Erythrobacter litoralis]MEE4337467.1 sterol desaturase family protein [Erythrobacter sp.]
MPEFSPTQYAVPLFVIAVLAEMIWARFKRPDAYEPKDTLLSLTFGLGSTVAGALLGGFALYVFIEAYEYRILDFGDEWWALWWAWPLCFVLDDLKYYWVHRAGHRIRWMWASHVNHHSSQHYNLSTALRQSWTGAFTFGFVFALPLVLLGFHPAMIAICAGFNLVYQFWIHTEAIRRMPRWFEAVMNTPSHHRVHHATNPRYLDRNYAGVFIVWDKLFGTFEPERDDEPIRYGIIRQLGSFNLLWAVFHEWIGMIGDIVRAPWKHKLSYLLREPGWSHDGTRETSDMIRESWRARTGQDSRTAEPVANRNPIAEHGEAA